MRNKKLRLLVILSVILVIQIGIAVTLFISGSNPQDTTQPPFMQQGGTVGNEVPENSTSTTGTGEALPVGTEPGSAETQTQPQETVKPHNGNTGSVIPPKNNMPTIPVVTEPPPLKFPYAIPGTELEIQKIDSYDGIFLEDGSDKSVTGIFAMVLVNKGSTGVEYANITMNQSGVSLEFRATAVPSGATVVVQESHATAYSSAAFTGCTAEVAVVETFEMSASQIAVKENEDGSLQVTNLTDQNIPCVRLFYKFVLEEGSIYVGGITYTAKITDLAPGASQRVIPSHYAAGSSEIVMVRTYDSAD